MKSAVPACMLVALVAVVAMALPCVMASSTFDPHRVRYIDRKPSADGKTTNYLFRGNLPVVDHKFAYHQMNETFHNIAANLSIPFPKQYYLVVVSLLQPLEFPDEEVEIRFFKDNPALGEYINWITVGDLVKPQDLPEDYRKKKAVSLDSWQIDRLPTKMQKLDDMLRVNGTMPYIYYIHCEAGMDRTGEMSGSYYLHGLNMTFRDALLLDDSLETRNISSFSQNGFQWYCYFLQYTSQPWRDCRIP